MQEIPSLLLHYNFKYITVFRTAERSSSSGLDPSVVKEILVFDGRVICSRKHQLETRLPIGVANWTGSCGRDTLNTR